MYVTNMESIQYVYTWLEALLYNGFMFQLQFWALNPEPIPAAAVRGTKCWSWWCQVGVASQAMRLCCLNQTSHIPKIGAITTHLRLAPKTGWSLSTLNTHPPWHHLIVKLSQTVFFLPEVAPLFSCRKLKGSDRKIGNASISKETKLGLNTLDGYWIDTHYSLSLGSENLQNNQFWQPQTQVPLIRDRQFVHVANLQVIVAQQGQITSISLENHVSRIMVLKGPPSDELTHSQVDISKSRKKVRLGSKIARETTVPTRPWPGQTRWKSHPGCWWEVYTVGINCCPLQSRICIIILSIMYAWYPLMNWL